jgi:nucleoside-diphosphate-sugar epimerase
MNRDDEKLINRLDYPYTVPEVLGNGARVVVTGCAGFIGSHLTEALLGAGCRVTGVDMINDYYDPALKHENLGGFLNHPRFEFRHADLLDLDPVDLLSGARAVFHLAAQAGVRASWGAFFNEYLQRNIQATQHLLEACRHEDVAKDLQRFVYSSSSSIYGNRTDLPVSETALPQPFSPYGVTKLAAEHLCMLYSANYGVPTTSLRYFTVYGPRQRPDMAFRKFLEAAFDGQPWCVFGDGLQTRDFTFVGDAVQANLLAVTTPGIAEVLNVGGGSRVCLNDVLDLMMSLLAEIAPQLTPTIDRVADEKGDVRDTWSDPSRGREIIGFSPRITLAEGLRQETAWVAERRSRGD